MSKGKVYLIDDDAGICAAVGLLLKTEGYEVDAYEHVIPFLRTIQRQTNGCAVADVRMPVMSGIELLQELKTRHIDLPVIFITGAADVPLAVKAMKLGAADFSRKALSR